MSATPRSKNHLKPPSPLWLFLEPRAIYEAAASVMAMPVLNKAPRGDGHGVLVLPGYLASDLSTEPLRAYLRHLGYRPFRWRLGRNLGLRPGLERRMAARLAEVRRRTDRRVSLIGWSLGGIYARELARQHPDSVRQVITLGSPFTGNPKANWSWRLFERTSGFKIDDMDPEEIAARQQTPPVPTTAIYSRSDGVTAWQCCVEQESDRSESVEVVGSHLGMGFNPLVLHVIADRLAQEPGQWRPFEREGLRKYLYPRPGHPTNRPAE
ncbi:MAG: alpha/beta hydrolase [Acidobacteriota bacterium]